MMPCYKAYLPVPAAYKISSSCLSTDYSTPPLIFTHRLPRYINVHKRITQPATRKQHLPLPSLNRTTLCTVHKKKPCTTQIVRSNDQSSQSCHQRLHALELFAKLPDVLGTVLILSAACLRNQCHTFGLGFGNLAL